jgi:hypothetical protein
MKPTLSSSMGSFPASLSSTNLLSHSYSLRSSQANQIPMSISCSADYHHHPSPGDGDRLATVTLIVSYTNSSSTMKLVDILSTIPLSSLQSITSVSHELTGNPSKDSSCSVSALMNIEGAPELRITISKLKPKSQMSLSITLQACSLFFSLSIGSPH